MDNCILFNQSNLARLGIRFGQPVVGNSLETTATQLIKSLFVRVWSMVLVLIPAIPAPREDSH